MVKMEGRREKRIEREREVVCDSPFFSFSSYASFTRHTSAKDLGRCRLVASMKWRRNNSREERELLSG
jgi:hypothetical protein